MPKYYLFTKKEHKMLCKTRKSAAKLAFFLFPTNILSEKERNISILLSMIYNLNTVLHLEGKETITIKGHPKAALDSYSICGDRRLSDRRCYTTHR